MDKNDHRVEADPVVRATKNLKFELLRQAFYHSDEVWFFSFIDRMTKFLSAIAGTAVVGSAIARHPNAAVAFGFAIAILQMYGLVFGISSKALLHESKRQRYFNLLAELEAARNLDMAEIARITSEMTRTWGDEPPIYWGVEVVARNSAMSTMKAPLETGDLIMIRFWEKLVRHVWRFNPEYFRHNGRNA